MSRIRMIALGFVVPFTLLLLQGCDSTHVQEETNNTDSTENSKVTNEGEVLIQELTLKVEDQITGEGLLNYYKFDGFIGEDTLSFHSSAENTVHVLAKVGHTFTFKNFKSVEKIEILEFSREERYVKLKVSSINTHRKGEKN